MQGAEIPSHADTSDVKVFHTSSRDGNNPTSDPDAKIVEMLANPINNISSLMTYKYGGSVPSGGGELHAVTMDLLKSLSSYSWDAKAVIALAAFAINYGEFWLVDHLRINNQLANNIATLMDLPDIMALDNQLKKLLEGVFNLLNQVLKVTHCIIEIMELPAKYIGPGSPEITAAKSHFLTAAYLIIRSLVVSASTLICSHEYVSSLPFFMKSTFPVCLICSQSHWSTCRIK
ncbi:hypothetical protein Pfo_009314 [Paulownia fortunei]|nr:hypothetical protein Pfo_009314 [Paulownia fortunei]